MFKKTFTLGADVGGKDAFIATREPIQILRDLLSCKLSELDTDINEIALILRIDGSVQAWEKDCIGKTSFRGKDICATCEIFIPIPAWHLVDETNFRRHLFSRVKEAILKIISKAEEKKIKLNRTQILSILEETKMEYIT